MAELVFQYYSANDLLTIASRSGFDGSISLKVRPASSGMRIAANQQFETLLRS